MHKPLEKLVGKDLTVSQSSHFGEFGVFFLYEFDWGFNRRRQVAPGDFGHVFWANLRMDLMLSN